MKSESLQFLNPEVELRPDENLASKHILSYPLNNLFEQIYSLSYTVGKNTEAINHTFNTYLHPNESQLSLENIVRLKNDRLGRMIKKYTKLGNDNEIIGVLTRSIVDNHLAFTLRMHHPKLDQIGISVHQMVKPDNHDLVELFLGIQIIDKTRANIYTHEPILAALKAIRDARLRIWEYSQR